MTVEKSSHSVNGPTLEQSEVKASEECLPKSIDGYIGNAIRPIASCPRLVCGDNYHLLSLHNISYGKADHHLDSCEHTRMLGPSDYGCLRSGP